MFILLDIIHCLKGKGRITQLMVGSGGERANQINRQVLFFVTVDTVLFYLNLVCFCLCFLSEWMVSVC